MISTLDEHNHPATPITASPIKDHVALENNEHGDFDDFTYGQRFEDNFTNFQGITPRGRELMKDEAYYFNPKTIPGT